MAGSGVTVTSIKSGTSSGSVGDWHPASTTDEPKGDVQHGHQEAQLGAGGGAQRPQVDGLVLAVRFAGVEEEDEAERGGQVDVVLGVEEDELVPAQGTALRVERAHRAHVHAPDLRLAAQEEALVVGELLGVAERADPGRLAADSQGCPARVGEVAHQLQLRPEIVDGAAQRPARHLGGSSDSEAAARRVGVVDGVVDDGGADPALLVPPFVRERAEPFPQVVAYGGVDDLVGVVREEPREAAQGEAAGEAGPRPHFAVAQLLVGRVVVEPARVQLEARADRTVQEVGLEQGDLVVAGARSGLGGQAERLPQPQEVGGLEAAVEERPLQP
jgi:hypothetical protein